MRLKVKKDYVKQDEWDSHPVIYFCFIQSRCHALTTIILQMLLFIIASFDMIWTFINIL